MIWLKANNKVEWDNLPIEEITKRSKILIIDNDPFPYTEILKHDGYNVDYWPGDIVYTERLENGYYDLILLDFHGVGVQFSSKQGIGVLEYIKKKNVTQIVIGVSNESWGIELHPFISLADGQMSKRESYADFKTNIDLMLQKRFSKQYYIDLILKQSSSLQKNEVEKYFKKSLAAHKPIEKYLPKSLDLNLINIITKITSIAINVYSTINNLPGGH